MGDGYDRREFGEPPRSMADQAKVDEDVRFAVRKEHEAWVKALEHIIWEAGGRMRNRFWPERTQELVRELEDLVKTRKQQKGLDHG